MTDYEVEQRLGTIRRLRETSPRLATQAVLFLDLTPAHFGPTKKLQLQGTFGRIGQRGRGVPAADSFDRLDLGGLPRAQCRLETLDRIAHRGTPSRCGSQHALSRLRMKTSSIAHTGQRKSYSRHRIIRLALAAKLIRPC